MSRIKTGSPRFLNPCWCGKHSSLQRRIFFARMVDILHVLREQEELYYCNLDDRLTESFLYICLSTFTGVEGKRPDALSTI